MSRNPSALSLAAVLLLLCTSTLTAQSPAQPAAPQQPATLRVTTRLVLVDAVVVDSKGQPATGLTKDDFTLSDQGKPQAISSLSEIGTSAAPGPTQPLPFNVFSNRPELAGPMPASVVVILFDMLNTTMEDLPYARNQTIQMLRHLRLGDPVAIYSLSADLRILHDFTTDTDPLIKVLEHYSASTSAELQASTARDPQLGSLSSRDQATASDILSAGSNLNGQMNDYYVLRRVEKTAAALEAVADHLARVPGRKTLIWISGAFPLVINMNGDSLTSIGRDSQSFDRNLERVARSLCQSDIVVYAVDARGLIVGGQSDARKSTPTPRSSMSASGEMATLETLADTTGGRVFYNSNDISGALEKSFADGRLIYRLSYYPNHGKWDGQFHEIKLRVNRPGLHVRYRRGYFAVPDLPDTPVERDAALTAALESPLDATNLSLKVAVEPPSASKNPMVTLVLELDARELLTKVKDQSWECTLAVLFQHRDSSDAPLNTDLREIKMRTGPVRYQALLRDGILVRYRLPLMAGAQSIRIVLRDPSTGRIGSVTVPLKRVLDTFDASGSGSAHESKPN